MILRRAQDERGGGTEIATSLTLLAMIAGRVRGNDITDGDVVHWRRMLRVWLKLS